MNPDTVVTGAAVLSAIGGFLFGLDIGYIAPILESAAFKRDVVHLHNWNDPASKVDGGTVGFIVGIFSLGCVCSACPIVSNYFLRSWGRRDSIVIGGLVFLLGCLLQVSASSMRHILIGRFVSGCSIGLLSTIVPLYQAEIAPAHKRGSLTSLYQLMITLGILVATLLDLFLLKHDGGWRMAILLQAVPAVLLLVGMPFLPRSPRWLVQKGRQNEARLALLSLRSEEDALKELEEIVASNRATEVLGRPGWREVTSGRAGRLLTVGVVLQLLQQLVGMNAMMYFGPRIFEAAGLPGTSTQTVSNSVNFFATFLAIYLADSRGRASLLTWGAGGMASASFMMGCLGHFYMSGVTGDLNMSSSSAGAAFAASVFVFIFCFAFSWGPMVWVYCAEIFPLEYRGLCVGLTTTANWIGNYIVAQTTPILLEFIGFNTFFIYGSMSLIALAVALWLPETKGVPMENIQQLFDRKFEGDSATAKSKIKSAMPFETSNSDSAMLVVASSKITYGAAY